MGLFDQFGITPGTNTSAEVVEKECSNSFELVPAGVHHAIVVDVEQPTMNRNGWKITYQVIAGAGNGKKITDTVWLPKGDDAKKDKDTKNRFLLVGHRLGVLRRDEKGNLVEIPGKDFHGAVGAACFIEVKHVTKQRQKDGVVQYGADGKPQTIQFAEIPFNGVLSPDDERIAAVEKATAMPVVAAKPAAANDVARFSKL